MGQVDPDIAPPPPHSVSQISPQIYTELRDDQKSVKKPRNSADPRKISLPARDHFYYCNYIGPKALSGISMESAQGLFLNFYDLIVFT